MAAELGEGWERKIAFFNPMPFAAASIGQVHAATLDADTPIAIKVQFPGVRESIDSDLTSLLKIMGVTMRAGSRLHEMSKNTMDKYKETWLNECDYVAEAGHLRKYRQLFDADADHATLAAMFDVPSPIASLCAERVLGMSFVSGTMIDQLCGSHIAQAVRDSVADRLVRIKWKELFEWGYINADPHMGNFVFNSVTQKLGLLDYGNCVQFADEEMATAASCLLACAERRKDEAVEMMRRVGGVSEQDSDAFVDQMFESQAFMMSPFVSEGAFDFRPWFDDPRIQGFKDNNEYMMGNWGNQQATEANRMHVEQALITEYTMQILLHCGRLRAVIPVQQYVKSMRQGIAKMPK